MGAVSIEMRLRYMIVAGQCDVTRLALADMLIAGAV